MKEIEKTRTKTEYYYVYEASDGTEFTNRDECLKYEGSAKCVLFTKYNEMDIVDTYEEGIFTVGCEDNDYDIVKVSTEKEAELIMQITLLCQNYLQNEKCSETRDKKWNMIKSCIGDEDNRLIIFRGCCGDDDFNPATTYKDLIKDIHKNCFPKEDTNENQGK